MPGSLSAAVSDDNSYAAVLARLTELERRQDARPTKAQYNDLVARCAELRRAYEELRLAHESTAALAEALSRELDDLRDEVRGYE